MTDPKSNTPESEALQPEVMPSEAVQSMAVQAPVPPIPNKCIPALARADRQSQVWQLRLRGVSIRGIANALGCHQFQVQRDLKAIGKRYRKELIDIDPLELVASNMQWFDEFERIALYEVHQAATKVQKIIDPVSGEVTTVEIADPNKSRFLQAALQARSMKVNLLLQTGVIPKDRRQLFDKLDNLDQKKEEIKTENRSEAEIKADLLKLMKYGRRMV